MITELPQHLQQSIADEVIQRLKTLGARANISEQGKRTRLLPVMLHQCLLCFLACHRVLKEICQLAELNSNSIFLKVNYEELKPMSHALHIHVLPFIRFYRGPDGRVCSFSCTNATKFEEALTKHGNHCSLEPAKRLDESGESEYRQGESFYNPHISRVIRELRKLELVEESEGACVISIEGVISFPLNVVKSDDGFN
ncbi:hypothetical protein G4B88_025205 [Cannabis sativa]|uniref:Arginyl-tRNA synthetase catalytic core domain-containing protein n=1 Tax=Cannabis sativa TaxID=3483 RepID=A0A7J6FZE6_CANSA|nr:hypothetical protein G4B88_025205 [Cannabis sativa]